MLRTLGYSIAPFFFHGDGAAAGDVTQQVFLKLMTTIGQFRGDSVFSTWLYRTVVNTCTDGARKNKSRADLVLVVLVQRVKGVTVSLAASLEDLGADLDITQNSPPKLFRRTSVRFSSPISWGSRLRKQPAGIKSLYQEFIPLQVEVLARYSDLIPGTVEATAALRERGLKIDTTTGYTAEMMDSLGKAAARQGLVRRYDHRGPGSRRPPRALYVLRGRPASRRLSRCGLREDRRHAGRHCRRSQCRHVDYRRDQDGKRNRITRARAGSDVAGIAARKTQALPPSACSPVAPIL
jgi:RNA polymerase sigma factor (sigma-70 family)